MILYQCDMCKNTAPTKLQRYGVHLKEWSASNYGYKGKAVHLCEECIKELADGLREIMKPIEPQEEKPEVKKDD